MSTTLGLGWLNGYYIVTDDEGNFVASGALAIADETDELNFGIDLVCLAPGDYLVELYDVLQDGVMTLEIGCAEEGNILIEAPNVETAFTVEAGVNCELGCTDEAASNYNELANFDFGCVYLGCTDELALNFDPAANQDDGSCIIAITGYVFFDAVIDGVFDQDADNGISTYEVFIQPSNQSVFTDANGYFEVFDLPDGTYMLSIQTSENYPILTTSESYTVEVSGTGIPPLNFGLTNEENAEAIQLNNLSLSNGVPCSGNPDVLIFALENTGSIVLSGEVTLTYDELYGGFNASIPTATSEGVNSVTFEFTDLAPATNRTYMVSLFSPAAENAGELVLNTLVASVLLNDVLVVLSEKVLEETVTCSPISNEKGAAPVGYEAPHFILQETAIEYLIHFQNTGNVVAESVLIRDTLDVNLDLNTFELVGQTHPAETTLDWNTREVTFLFENIQLPSASADALESNGAISYRILPLADAEAGTVLGNTAFIYFDQNPELSTTNVFHTLYACGEEATISVDTEVCLDDVLEAEATAPFIEYWNWNLDEEFLSATPVAAIETGASGTFVLELTAGNALCETTESVEITVFNLPNPQILQDGSVLTCDSGQSLQWFLNGVAIDGAIQNAYTLTEEGVYTVEIVNINGCVGTSDPFFATPVNVFEAERIAMAFYPNPMANSGTLQLSHSGQWEVSLLDATGRVVAQARFVGTTWTLQRASLAPGLYFLRVKGDGEMKAMEVLIW